MVKLFVVSRDINFNSCTMCVCCTNDGNIRGGESLLYLPDMVTADEDYDCKCGYSVGAATKKFI